MKNKLNIVLLFFLLCFWGSLLGSCTDEMSNEENVNDGKVTLHVKFNTRADAGITDPLRLNKSEYRIKTIRLYAFDGEELDNMVYQTEPDNVTGTATVKIDVKVANNKTFYAVINEPEVDAIQTALALANHPNGIKQVQYSIDKYSDSKINAMTRTDDYVLPMYGKMQASVTGTPGTALYEIEVSRAVARIDIYMMKANGVTSNATTDVATLTVEHSATNGYIAKDNVVAAEPSKKFDMDYPKAETLNAYNANDTTKYKKIYSFYVPEQSCTEEEQRLKFTLGGISWNGTVMPQPYNEFYLGNDGNNSAGTKLNKLERNKVYQIYCRLKPTSKDVELTVITQPWNLAIEQKDTTAIGEINMVNCYMVTPGGSTIISVSNVYKIWAWADELKNDTGENDFISKDKTVYPEVIWSDTDGLIASVSLLPSSGSIDDKDHARIKVQTTPGKQGNAVVGMRMKDKNGNLETGYRWSWHIWVMADQPKTIDLGTMIAMDRNLGAITSKYADQANLTNGLYYQWGRKDPYPAAATWKSTDEIPIYGVINTITNEDVTADMNLINAINNPATFYTSALGDWYTLNGEQNDKLWGGQKTIYDPCPDGWKVPTEISFWRTLTVTNFVWQNDLLGRLYSDLIYYPASGVKDSEMGDVSSGGSNGYYWSTDLNVLSFFNRRLSLDIEMYRASGYSVRCVKE